MSPERGSGSGTTREPDGRGALDAGVMHCRAELGAAAERLGGLDGCELVAHGDVIRVFNGLVDRLILDAEGFLRLRERVVDRTPLGVVRDLVPNEERGHGDASDVTEPGLLGEPLCLSDLIMSQQ